MELDGERVLLEGPRQGKAAAPDSVVEAAHVPADGHGLFHLQLHEPLDEEDAFLAMAVGEHVLHAVAGDFLPLARRLVLHVAGAFFVEVGLAQVVEQCADGEGLLAVLVRREEGAVEHAVDVQAVRTQPALAGPVEAGGRRRGEEVRLAVHPVQQLLAAGPGDVGAEYLQKFLAVRHLTAPYPRGCPSGWPARRGSGRCPCPCGCRPGTSRGCRTWVRLRSS